jgi:signal transduction histidine kinase
MEKKLIKLRDEVLGDVSGRQYLKTPYLVFAAAILLTVGTTYFFYRSAEANDHARFVNNVTKIQTTIDGRLDSYKTLLKAGRGFLEASKANGKEINKESFAVFIKELELEKSFPGAQGIGFIKKVVPADQAGLVEKMRSDGQKDFAILPAPPASEDAYVLLYLEPLQKDTNAAGIGYALSSDPMKLAAIEKAAASGEPTISERLILIPRPVRADSPRFPGFQLFVPIYRSSDIPVTAEKRNADIESLLYCPFRANKFIDEVRNASEVFDVSFAIYDQRIDPEKLLGESEIADPKASSSAMTQSLSRAIYDTVRYEHVGESNVGGEKWLIRFQSLPSFHSNSATGWTLILFFFGLGISLILFFITLSQSKAHTSLEVIAEDLARSERVKDEFIAVVSHELRTPLNSIAGGVTIMRNRNVTDETRNKALDIIEKNLRSQAGLVEDMIVFSDINAGKGNLHFKPFSFSQLTGKVFNEFVSKAKKNNISFIKEDTTGDKMVAGDEAKLERVLQSILSNSIKFTPPQGMIAMEVKTSSDCVELRIKDNGYGIHPQVLPHVFDLFKQGDSSTVRRHGGLGLGMALSRHIVKLHGGTLDAESAGVGKGSTFILRLPVAENNA